MVRRALLDEHLQLLRDVGIRPAAVTASSIGLANIFLQSHKERADKTFLLADLNESTVEVLVLRGGMVAYSQQIPRQEGEDWKALILREMSEAAAQMRMGPEDTLEKMVFAGESSAAVLGEMKSEFPDCELMGKSIRIIVPRENNAHVQEAGAALGLAYSGMVRRPPIRVNLLPSELRVRQTRWAYVPAAILGLAILALLVMLGFHRMAQNRMLVRELDQAIASNKAPVARVQALRTEAEALETKIKFFEDLLRRKDMNLEVLRELTTILPADTYLINYSNRDGTILMVGFSGSYSDLVPNLEQSPLLKDVVPKGTIYKDAQTGKDRFTIEAKLEK
jgi:Tfp pilus assembly protein PilN